ncbi:IS21 family transposase, partial [Phocaeicola plebeius]
MAGTTKDMSLIKQVLQLKQAGESNRGVSRKLPIDKETVNGYVNTVKANGWNISDLLEIDDPELERMFHAGSPAYTDRRMEEFLILLPRYRELLADPKSHVSRQVLFDEYRATHPDGYGKSQFYYHLKQNLVAKKDVTAVLANTYKPGEKLMVDFAGDKLSYVDAETGEIVKVEVFVACMPYSDYTYVVCVPSQKTEDFLYAIRMCLEHLGGVPSILTPDNLKSAVISNDRHEPKLNKALEDMGNYYHFVVLPCDPASPTQKALVEDSVRITYNRVYARLRNRTFHSLLELNRAVWELMERHNQTRMQKRPYSREERFHAMEKELLKPLKPEPYEMRLYADLKVQANCHVELRQDKVTHFYSVPYIHVGKQARVVFTRSWVKVYVEQK